MVVMAVVVYVLAMVIRRVVIWFHMWMCVCDFYFQFEIDAAASSSGMEMWKMTQRCGGTYTCTHINHMVSSISIRFNWLFNCYWVGINGKIRVCISQKCIHKENSVSEWWIKRKWKHSHSHTHNAQLYNWKTVLFDEKSIDFFFHSSLEISIFVYTFSLSFARFSFGNCFFLR